MAQQALSEIPKGLWAKKKADTWSAFTKITSKQSLLGLVMPLVSITGRN